MENRMLNHRYKLESEIGRGGMGVVYRATDTKLNRTVAIKILPPEFVHNVEFLARFKSEIINTSILIHPNIVSVFDVGVDGDTNFYVMQFVDGQDLRAYMNQHSRLSITETCQILEKIASALDYAHSNGIIHRDIKPENILIDNNGVPSLTDFGIASLMEGTRITMGIVGSPEYMSPEQGRGEPVCGRSDQYSLTIIAYEMLTGTTPFRSSTAQPWVVITKHINEPPADPRTIVSTLAKNSAEAIMKGLAKNIGQRYPSCARFVDAIKSNVVTTSHINQLPSQPNITAPTLVFNRGETAINGNTKVYERPNPSLPQLTKKIERNDGAINIGTPVKQRLSVKSIVIFSVSFLLCMIIIIAVGNKSKPSISENSNNTPSTPVDTPSNTVSPSIKNNDRTTTVVTTKTPVSLNNTTTDTKTDINTNKTILSPSTIVYNDTLKTNPKDGAEMVLITAGEFIMGSTDYEKDALAHEKPQRKVYLDAYYMYKTEVTVSQYRKFCAATGWKMPVAPNWGWKENHPIVNVTWNDSKAYSEWANASLPTEAQWEKAARGTDGRIFPWGNDWENGAKCVNWTSSTKPVGSILAGASPYGMLDMAGNVWEWCIDWYGSDYYKTALAKNPTGPTSGDYRVLRGGSWNGNGCSSYFYGYNRCACRFNYYPINYIDGYIGFRCTFPIQ